MSSASAGFFGGLAITETFIAYIDESGDEGYQILKPPKRKSTEWFALSAVICHGINVPQLDLEFQSFYQCKAETTKSRKPQAPFHFRNGHHHECVAYCETVLRCPVRVITVFAHKPSMAEEAAVRTEKHYLFDYASKLLIERISWYCDENHAPFEDGSVRLIFSDRRQLKLERLQAYLAKLRTASNIAAQFGIEEWARNTIRWRCISNNAMEVQPHDSMTGLQIADAIASASTKAVERTAYQTTEHRYMKILAPRFYRRKGKCRRYGIKFIPDTLPEENPFLSDRFHWLKHFQDGLTPAPFQPKA